MYKVLAPFLLPSLFQMLSSLSPLDWKCPSHTPRLKFPQRPTHLGRSVSRPWAKLGKHLSALRGRLGSPDHVCPVHCCTRGARVRAGHRCSGRCVKEEAVLPAASERRTVGAASLGRQARARLASQDPGQAAPPPQPRTAH